MENREIAIVAIAYNRVHSLRRLLTSLRNAEYFEERIELVISIDYSGNDSVYEFAQEFEWPFGNKRIIRHEENLGLRKHVLFCGSLTAEYQNICVFEDDVFVAPAFYNFAKQASNFYKDDERVAGISLYTHMWNYIANRPFLSISNEFDVFFMQQAQSWGQVWSQKKWNAFIHWYNLNNTENLEHAKFPEVISNWPKTSWLKYHMKYLVETNRYFVYPKQSLTTNFSDVGTHAVVSSNCYQVPLELGIRKIYRFIKTVDDTNSYDVFFENNSLYDILGLDKNKITVDLYGQKSDYERYLLTSRQLNFKIVKSFGLKLRPHELNIYLNIKGDNIFLYDTCKRESNPINKYYFLYQFIYDIRTNAKKDLLKTSLYFYLLTLKKIVKSILKK